MEPAFAFGVIAQAAANVPTSSPSWGTLITVVLGSSLVSSLISFGLSGLRTSAEVRREGYAETSRVLIARVEFPYRVRRRTNDEPDTLAELSRKGSDIQERLAAQRTWVSAESRTMSRILDKICEEIAAEVGRCATDAWAHPAISRPEQMNLGDWGPRSTGELLDRFRRAAGYRFGWRRMLPPWIWGRKFLGSEQ